MAEPMGSNEIEDVLSSIRRLVAQDLKPADRARLAAVAEMSNKLVLSPESRVLSEDGAPKFVTVRRPSRRAAFPAIDEVLPSMDGTVGTSAGVLEESVSDARNADWSLGQIDPAEFVAPVPTAFSVDPQSRLSDVAPEAFGANLDDTAADNAQFDQALASVPEQEYEEDLNELSAPHLHHWPEDINEPAEQQSFHGTIEPDAEWANAAEARVLAELAGETAEEAVTYATKMSEPNFAYKSATVAANLYDEDALRALIQTIFREEMAGTMGERITRNIRKLVRAEVGRMLAAQDLE